MFAWKSCGEITRQGREQLLNERDAYALGSRLVAEAYEHVRSFDWGDVAEQTAAVYADMAGAKLGPA